MKLSDLYTELSSVQHHLGSADWRMSLLGAISELIEALHELPWRPWRVADQRQPTPREKNAALDELVDAFCTIPRICIALDITAEEFEAACIRHVERKWSRIENGIDSQTEQLKAYEK